MDASQRVKNGVWTMAAIWPAAAIIRLMATTTVGWVVSCSEGSAGSYGVSKDGKSKGVLDEEVDIGER